ncbi:MAG: hypothetical protein HOP17_09880 [Acidobacteria bacterium]|nr:hypothetical protein [Acidobacteriota bacterium]
MNNSSAEFKKSDDRWKAPDIVPSIAYSNVEKAVEWLERVFGFKERSESRLSWPGGGMAWMEVGNSLFQVGTPDETWGQTTENRGVMMKVYVDELDRHYDNASMQGAEIVCEPMDGFWGGRTYRALDLEGNMWEISQAGRDLSSDQWKLPPGVVRGKS